MRQKRLQLSTQAVELDTRDWDAYLGTIAGDGKSVTARITIEAGGKRGESSAVGWPLLAIRYDANADELEVHVGRDASGGAGLRYFVSAPRAIRVHEDDGARTLIIDDAGGVHTLIHLSDELPNGASGCT